MCCLSGEAKATRTGAVDNGRLRSFSLDGVDKKQQPFIIRFQLETLGSYNGVNARLNLIPSSSTSWNSFWERNSVSNSDYDTFSWIHAAAPFQHIFNVSCGISEDWDFVKKKKKLFLYKRPRWDCERGRESDILCLSRFIFSVSPQTKLKKAENFSLKTPGSFVKDVSNFNECCGIYGVEGNCDGKSMASWGEVVVSRVKGVKWVWKVLEMLDVIGKVINLWQLVVEGKKIVFHKNKTNFGVSCFVNFLNESILIFLTKLTKNINLPSTTHTPPFHKPSFTLNTLRNFSSFVNLEF